MCRFIETVLYKDGEMPLIRWHEKRFIKTQQENFPGIVYPSLEQILIHKIPLNLHPTVSYKCRVLYDTKEVEIDFSSYQKRNITQLLIKTADKIEYPYKYANRECLYALTNNLQQGEEILIVKNGLLTDTSFTNIALFDGSKWFTPEAPLLGGVQRSFLIAQNIIKERDIKLSELKMYSRIRLFNAMNNWNNAWDLKVADVLI